MFYCRNTSDDRSDATASYEWDCPKRSTVRDFIEYKEKLNSVEFGHIHFGKKFNTYHDYRYSNFKDCGALLERYGERIIKSPVKADGGWNQMDYWIELEEEIERGK